MTPTHPLAAHGTALVSDAAFRIGASFGVGPAGLTTLHPDWSLAGPAVTIEANDDLPAILHGLHSAPTGSVLVIAARPERSAVIGDLIVTEAARRELAGIVVDGRVRDLSTLLSIGLPVAASGTYPIGPLKLPDRGIGAVGGTIVIGETPVEPGDWVIADGDGTLVIPAAAVDDVTAAANASLIGEKHLIDGMALGTPLGTLLGIEDFMATRADDGAADFNDHLWKRGGAI